MALARRTLIFSTLVVVVTALLVWRSQSVHRAAAPLPAGEARVVRVIDGDTIDLDFGTGESRARLVGIDTPETVDEQRPVQCYGPEASARLHALLPAGTIVRVERDVESRDRFGRLLLYVYRADDGVFINRVLLAEGYATTLSIAPNRAHAAEFERVLVQAKRARAGLWGACASFGAPQPTAG